MHERDRNTADFPGSFAAAIFIMTNNHPNFPTLEDQIVNFPESRGRRRRSGSKIMFFFLCGKIVEVTLEGDVCAKLGRRSGKTGPGK